MQSDDALDVRDGMLDIADCEEAHAETPDFAVVRGKLEDTLPKLMDFVRAEVHERRDHGFTHGPSEGEGWMVLAMLLMEYGCRVSDDAVRAISDGMHKHPLRELPADVDPEDGDQPDPERVQSVQQAIAAFAAYDKSGGTPWKAADLGLLATVLLRTAANANGPRH